MARGVLVAIKALLPNNEIARFGMRYAFTGAVDPTAQDLIDIATAAQVELNNAAFLFSTDMLLGLCTAQTFEHEPAVGVPPYSGPGEHAAYWSPVSAEQLSTVAGVNGLVAEDSSPPQVAVAVTLRTALAGRSHLGRVFTFPPPETIVDGDGTVLDAGLRATMVSDIDAAIVAVPLVNGDPLTLSVFSALLDVSEPVVSIVANSRVDTQRRRLQR